MLHLITTLDRGGAENALLHLCRAFAAAGRWDQRVAWIKGGSLAVQRMNRAQTRLELLDCSPDTGACRAILEEKDARWLNVGDDSHFFDRQFLPSVRAGTRYENGRFSRGTSGSCCLCSRRRLRFSRGFRLRYRLRRGFYHRRRRWFQLHHRF